MLKQLATWGMDANVLLVCWFFFHLPVASAWNPWKQCYRQETIHLQCVWHCEVSAQLEVSAFSSVRSSFFNRESVLLCCKNTVKTIYQLECPLYRILAVVACHFKKFTVTKLPIMDLIFLLLSFRFCLMLLSCKSLAILLSCRPWDFVLGLCCIILVLFLKVSSLSRVSSVATSPPVWMFFEHSEPMIFSNCHCLNACAKHTWVVLA